MVAYRHYVHVAEGGGRGEGEARYFDLAGTYGYPISAGGK